MIGDNIGICASFVHFDRIILKIDSSVQYSIEHKTRGKTMFYQQSGELELTVKGNDILLINELTQLTFFGYCFVSEKVTFYIEDSPMLPVHRREVWQLIQTEKYKLDSQ